MKKFVAGTSVIIAQQQCAGRIIQSLKDQPKHMEQSRMEKFLMMQQWESFVSAFHSIYGLFIT